MLRIMLFAASMLFLQPIEIEARDYIQDAHMYSKNLNEYVKIIETHNGVMLRIRKADSALLRFDLLGNGLSYGNITIGKEINKSDVFTDKYGLRDGTICYIKKFDDNSILRIYAKDGIVRKITRLSREITEA